MNFRCKQCHQTVWFEEDRKSAKLGTACQGCGQRYELKAWRKPRTRGDRLAGDARRLALEKAIDLPGAYSVLLGVMSVEEVREFGGGRRTEAPSPRDKGRYDPAFAEAVGKGYLTSKQALERGRREVYATKLSQRRDLPMKLAYAVADNRISLLEALRQAPAKSRNADSVKIDVPGGKRPIALLAALAVVAVVGVSLVVRSGNSEIVSTHLTTNLGDATIVTNTVGQVLKVAGPNPRSVLRAFCRAGDDGLVLEEVSLIPASARLGRARLGLLRHPSDPESLLSILIQEDRENGNWFVGDGTSLVVPEEAPPGAEKRVLKPTTTPPEPTDASSD